MTTIYAIIDNNGSPRMLTVDESTDRPGRGFEALNRALPDGAALVIAPNGPEIAMRNCARWDCATHRTVTGVDVGVWIPDATRTSGIRGPQDAYRAIQAAAA